MADPLETITKSCSCGNNKIYNIPKKTGINNLNLGLSSNYSYKIYDESGIVRYRVEGAVFSFGEKFKMYDEHGNLLYQFYCLGSRFFNTHEHE